MRTLEDLEQAFEVGLREWETAIVIKYANRMGMKMVREAKRLTPVKTGNLRRRWFTKVNWRGKDIVIELSNDAEYAAPVNNGHRLVRAGKTVGYRQGFHMLEKGIKTYEDNYMAADVQDMLQALRGKMT